MQKKKLHKSLFRILQDIIVLFTSNYHSLETILMTNRNFCFKITDFVLTKKYET